MNLLEQLGKQTITLGSASDADLRFTERRVSSHHAEIVHTGQGRLMFVPGSQGPCFRDGERLAAQVPVPFDFQSRFALDTVPVPSLADRICLMLMQRGTLRPSENELIIGRDPSRVHIVLSSPGVSGKHLILSWPGPLALDASSTSGTWHEGVRLPAETKVALPKDATLAVGPLPLPLALAERIHAALLAQGARGPRAFAQTAAFSAGPGGLTPERPPEQVMGSSSSGERLSLTFDRVSSPSSSAKHRTLMGTVRMEVSRDRSIGRATDSDIVLDNPQVSARHARLLLIGGQLFIEDRGSELGTYVRGVRLKSGQRVPVNHGERIYFGPLAALLSARGEEVDLELEDQADWAGRQLFELTASGLRVEVTDRAHLGKKKTLLDGVSFFAGPGDRIALLGPSGSGKTTLLHVLTGYSAATQGELLVNGSPMESMRESLRGSIGYVPQDDIIHPELTVWEAVRYSARLRLPKDYSDQEIDRRVEETLVVLGLEAVSHLQLGRPEAKVLSGGQRKRVNIAIELVTDPVLLFLDEPTSGLAADDTAALVDLLKDLAQKKGKTVIATIHQPAKDEFEKFNLTLVLGHGGVPVYFGPTKDAYAFFESWRPPEERRSADNPRDMFAEIQEREARLLGRSESRPAARAEVARAFRRDYEASPISLAMAERSSATERGGPVVSSRGERKSTRAQLGLLSERYIRVKLRDRVGTAILLGQAPVIGVLLALVFGSQKSAVPYFCLSALKQLTEESTSVKNQDALLKSLEVTQDHSAALFFLVVSAVWFGTSNAAREIVSERAIYRRERMVNLGLLEYVVSKFLILGALSVLQCLVLLTIVWKALALVGGAAGFASTLGMLALTSLCSVALGLLLSAVVASSEAAMALTPIALIPQVVLGGLMVPVTTVPWLGIPMRGIPARWGFEGVIRVQRLGASESGAWNIRLGEALESPSRFIENGTFACARAQLLSHDLTGAWGFSTASHGSTAALVLTSMTLALLAIVLWRLRSGDRA